MMCDVRVPGEIFKVPTDGRKVDAEGQAVAAGRHIGWPSVHRMDDPSDTMWALGEPNGDAAEMCINMVKVQPSGLNDVPCDALLEYVVCECSL